MTHDELLAKLNRTTGYIDERMVWGNQWHAALLAVVELHKPQEITLPDGEWGENCEGCDIGFTYPCPTIQAIEKELK